MEVSIYFWIGFHVLIFLILGIDLGILSKKAHKVPLKEALLWSGVWIIVALAFNLFVFFEFGKTRALEFLTGYLIEYSLSVDNIFVFILIFSYFAVPEKYQHKVLFWGIIGALVMRGIFIFAGVALINRFHWIVIIFGGFLIVTGIKMMVQKDVQVDPSKNPVMRFARKFLPVTEESDKGRFFTRLNSKMYVTPLFLVLLIIESTDLLFAVDSIPAVLAVSHERFIVYTSNIFAILGLRSLYFAVSGIMGYFRYLKTGLAFILTFVGLKMVASFFHFEIPILISLAFIVSILIISILASVLISRK
ncbi:MAG: TerC/Alx family metal homeostasis membrane protein [Bacteroidales bacterium]|nr:TerC/Alx family metal homeostasis membrane protein [Bacteroidales bacterium]HOU02404.1 TerC family protein [Bacteroidales bacterium]HQK68742.1 TerC family protein [Bacteroidales bacterium]